jgi:hypothetical protein
MEYDDDDLIRRGVVKGRVVGVYGNGTAPVLLLTTAISDPTDIHQVQFMSHSGIDANPADGSIATIVSLSRAWKVALGTDDGITPETNAGEFEIYSSAAGAKKAQIRCTAAGKIAIQTQGASESLKSILDALITAIDGITTFGSPGSHSLTQTSKDALNAIKTRIDAFLTEI